MARIRSIKPEFWTDEKLAECSVGARLLFIGTWNFADDEGRMEYSPKRLKMQVFPGDDIDVAPLVEELTSRGLVIVYRIASREFLAIPNFSKHQRVDKPKASRIPEPGADDSGNSQRQFQEASPNVPRALATEGKGREGNRTSSSQLKPSSDRETPSRVETPVQPSQEASMQIADQDGDETDPRHAPIRGLIQKLHLNKFRVKCEWDGSEAKELKHLLTANPSWTEEQLAAMVHNRFDSDEIPSARPRKWLSSLGSYASGPLDRYGKPKAPKANGHAAGLSPSEIARRQQAGEEWRQ